MNRRKFFSSTIAAGVGAALGIGASPAIVKAFAASSTGLDGTTTRSWTSTTNTSTSTTPKKMATTTSDPSRSNFRFVTHRYPCSDGGYYWERVIEEDVQ